MDAPLPGGLVQAWEEFLARPSHNLDQLFDHPMLFPLQRKREAVAMLRMASTVEPRTVMEIGADKGGGVYAWCQLPTVRKVFACEIRGTPYREAFERAFPRITFSWHPEPSQVACHAIKRWHNLPEIDVLFVDGDKSRFREDFDSFLPLMSPSGVVFLHDVRDDGPRQAWESIRAGLPEAAWSEHRDVSESDEARRRQHDGVPAATAHEEWVRHWDGASAGFGVVWTARMDFAGLRGGAR